MNWMLIIAITGTSLIIFLEDFKNRTVHFFLFPLLGLFGFISTLLRLSVSQALTNTFINLCIVSTQLIALILYLKYIKKNTPVINRLVGLGDILFIITCGLFFSPLHFLGFYILSLVFSLALHFLFLNQTNYTGKDKTVALAGWQSLFLTVIILTSSFFHYDLTSDSWLLHFMIK